MNEAKHTKGPWIIGKAVSRRQFRPDDCIEIQTSLGSMVCILYARNASMDGRVDQANARLIAAAPDLLEALRRIGRLWPEPPFCAPVNPEWVGEKDGKQRAILLEAALNIAREATAKAEGK